MKVCILGSGAYGLPSDTQANFFYFVGGFAVIYNLD